MTDKGILHPNFEEKKIWSAFNVKRYTYMRSVRNTFFTYSSHGRFFPEDAHLQLVIHPSMYRTDIVRSYFTLVNCLSSIGGIFEAFFVTIFVSYYLYNIYEIKKYVI